MGHGSFKSGVGRPGTHEGAGAGYSINFRTSPGKDLCSSQSARQASSSMAQVFSMAVLALDSAAGASARQAACSAAHLALQAVYSSARALRPARNATWNSMKMWIALRKRSLLQVEVAYSGGHAMPLATACTTNSLSYSSFISGTPAPVGLFLRSLPAQLPDAPGKR